MSVRKLALAIASRVNMLRKHLVAHPQRSLRAVALVATVCGSTTITPGTTQAQVAPGHTPFQDPFAFDPDFNWFEPIYQADFEDMKPKKRANRGWFGSYDRINLYSSRPEGGDDSSQFDSGWGHRYDVGFMLEEETGWLASYIDLNGPNAFDGHRRERLNRLNEDQQIVILGVGDDGDPSYTIFPRSDRNNPGYNTRFVDVLDSDNVSKFDSFELNKTWRLEPYHYGGILEPLVGFRYMRFNSLDQDMEYDASLRVTLLAPDTPPLPVGAQEVVTTDAFRANNDMLGGQIGFRYFKFQDRFRYSAELRVFTMANFQMNTFRRTEETTIYGGTTVGIGDEPLAYVVDKTPTQYRRNEEFAFGFDTRAEVSYTLTKMFEIRGGFQLIDIAQGLWRGDFNSRTDQQHLMMGATFGIAVNR
jgi:hypothetical protein